MTTYTAQSDQREISDPGEENQRSQIQALNTTREQISEIRTRGRLELSERQRLTALRATVGEYISKLAPYLADDELQPDGDEPALWDEKELGTVSVSPPPFESMNLSDRYRLDAAPEPKEIDVVGVADILRLGVEYPVEFQFSVVSPISGTETVAAQRNAAPDEDLLMRAVLEVDSFRRRSGLGLQLEEENDHDVT